MIVEIRGMSPSYWFVFCSISIDMFVQHTADTANTGFREDLRTREAQKRNENGNVLFSRPMRKSSLRAVIPACRFWSMLRFACHDAGIAPWKMF